MQSRRLTVDERSECEAIYRAHIDRIVRRCATLGDPQEAEDAAHDAFLTAFLNLSVAVSGRGPGEYLGDRVRIDAGTRTSRVLTVPWPPADPVPAYIVDAEALIVRREEIAALIGQLPPRERHVLRLSWHGYTYPEIGELLGRAAGTVSIVVLSMRRRARKIVGEFTASAALLLARGRPRRLRGTICGGRSHRRHHAIGWRERVQAIMGRVGWVPAEGPHTLVSLVVVALVLGGSAPAAPPLSRHHAVASADRGSVTRMDGPSSDGAPPVLPPRSAVTTGTAPGGHHLGRDLIGPPITASIRLSSGAAETPADTRLVDATPSPRYERDHTIIAVGRGTSCACSVLFRSVDGGATWAASSGPSAPTSSVDQVVLPPAYPQDPRIFLGSSPSSGSADFVASSFGAPFEQLPLPPGHVALSAGFDAGDPRLFAATTTGVMAYDLDSGILTLVVATTDPTVTASVATPTDEPDQAVLVLAPPHASSPGGSVGLPTSDWSLLACGRAGGCGLVTTLNLAGPAQLAVSPTYATDHTLAAFSTTHLDSVPDIDVSTDGGRRFSPVHAPQGSVGVQYLALVQQAAGGAALWAVTWTGSRARVALGALPEARWRDVTGDDPVFAITGLVVPLDSHRALYVAPDRDLRCTNDLGLTWMGHCPVT